MTSIVFFSDPASDDPQYRIAGMISAGAMVKSRAGAVTNKNGADALVNKILADAIANHASEHVELDTSGGHFTILAKVGNNYPLQGTNDKLQLSGDVDWKDANVHKMLSVIPARATDQTWSYITDRIVPDTLEIINEIVSGQKDTKDLENYLIATFTFTRCR